MKTHEITESVEVDHSGHELIPMLKDFFPLAVKELGIDSLPDIKVMLKLPQGHQPTFGKFVNDENRIYLAIQNRHPLDIIRTLAHELVHYRQHVNHQLSHNSGETGSPEENEAHAVAGVIMRHFNKQHPQYFDDLPIELAEDENSEVVNYKKLDRFVIQCVERVIQAKKKDLDYYGMVGACVIDPEQRAVFGVNHRDQAGKRIHAERAAIMNYHGKYGAVPEGSIIISTLSPCNEPMDERHGVSCTDLINQSNVKKVYCGYIDPTQDSNQRLFGQVESSNPDVRKICKTLADTFLSEDADVAKEQLPHLYLDMDGVQADFFHAWAQWERVHHYKDIPDSEESITRMSSQGPEFVEKFFATLPQLAGGRAIVQWLHQHRIPFTVLSAPLRGNHEASIRGKRAWLDQYVPGSSAEAIFTPAKFKYATANGKPNVLVDDFGKYINSWRDAGGIAIKHEDANTANTIRALEEIYLKPIKENFADGKNPGRNSQLNTLHDPQRMAGAVAYLTDYYDSKEEAYRIIDAYMASVDKLITQGGTVYRAVWVAPGQKPKLKQPGLHWTLTPQSAEEYLQSEAGEYAAMDMDLDDQPHAYILSATVGPNNITNHGVNFAQQHHEQEVRIVDPKQAQIKVVKQVGMTENFADGRNPQDKGDAKRHGINTKASVSSLRKTAKQGGRKGQLAHWMANMKAGRAKKARK